MMSHNSESKLDLLLKSYAKTAQLSHKYKMREKMLEVFNFYENAGDFFKFSLEVPSTMREPPAGCGRVGNHGSEIKPNHSSLKIDHPNTRACFVAG